jgi:transcriptional regulator with XRE-family HTH domain
MAKQPKPLTDTLKAAITKSGLTHYALAKIAGTTPGQIDRFMSGERDLRLGTAAAIAAAIGLELRPI